ncbi:MAG: type II toxin-antitoxin system PemK/MazF family toxin [Tissierellia bacterium]|jgi:mRNA interferase MazF|nr:type II toxin-antitoxin system PemK/MazF family toxin [Tissierellia bacterium]
MVVKRGDLFYANLSPVLGSEQGGIRPVVIIQNDVGNKYSPTVIVAPITSRMNKTKLPTHVKINASEKFGLPKDSVVLLEQIRTIDKQRLKDKIGKFDKRRMSDIDNAILTSLELEDIE